MCSSEGLLAARPGFGCGRRGTGSVHRSGHRPGRGRFACAAGCCLQHRGEYGAPRLAGIPRGRVRCGGCPAALGAPSLAALLRAVLGPGHGGHGVPRTPRGTPPLLGFGHVSGAASAVWCFGRRGATDRTRSRSSAGRLTCAAEQPGAARWGSRAEPRPVPRHRGERVPAAPLPAPRPACSVLPRCRGLRCENACPSGKRNVCKMFAVN